MRTSTIVSTLAVAVSAMGQMMNTTRPANTSMCDYYAKLTNHPQYVLLTALVNTAVIGNYSNGSMNAVTGILNNGTYEGRPVSLLKYFDGMLASTNRGGDSGVSVNFLDGGAADPLKMNKPANDTSSNQYFLLTHLYSYFGALLNCSDYGQMGFPAYSGGKSQYEVHKFMDLSHDEVSYFIQEVGLAATSFGVSAQDATSVGMALGKLFNYKCAPETTVIPAQGPALQSICIADDCPTAANSSCAAYQKDKISMPVASNDTNKYTSTSMMPTGTAAAGGSGSGTDSATSTTESGAAATMHAVGAVAMGIAGFAALAAGL